MFLIIFFFYLHSDLPDIHSFPTRRSSDLSRRLRGKSTRRADDGSGTTWPDREYFIVGGPETYREHLVRTVEHRSQLDKNVNIVCRLPLEKKKKYIRATYKQIYTISLSNLS